MEEARKRIALYYANLAQMDDCLGRVISALRDLELEKDTIVALHDRIMGRCWASTGCWQKFMFYEPSVGIPMIFRVPGVTAAGSRSPGHVSNVDLLPTLAQLCRVSVPAKLDGKSFVSLMKDPQNPEDRTVFSEYNLRTPNAKYMIRRGDYKFCHYVNDISELYDLKKDPDEMRNLALLPEYRTKVEEMRGQLFAWYAPPESNRRA